MCLSIKCPVSQFKVVHSCGLHDWFFLNALYRTFMKRSPGSLLNSVQIRVRFSVFGPVINGFVHCHHRNAKHRSSSNGYTTGSLLKRKILRCTSIDFSLNVFFVPLVWSIKSSLWLIEALEDPNVFLWTPTETLMNTLMPWPQLCRAAARPDKSGLYLQGVISFQFTQFRKLMWCLPFILCCSSPESSKL